MMKRCSFLAGSRTGIKRFFMHLPFEPQNAIFIKFKNVGKFLSALVKGKLLRKYDFQFAALPQ